MPTSEELNALAQAVAAGDRQAFATLFKYFAPRVKAYLLRAGSADGVAEDLTQDTMVMVWRKAALFDPGKAALSTWIFTIARNLRVDHYRRQGQHETELQDAELDEAACDAPSPDEQMRSGRRQQGVREALARLAPEQALLLRLSFYEEHPHARIAQELGIPLGTVKSRIRLAVQHLRRMLDGLEP